MGVFALILVPIGSHSGLTLSIGSEWHLWDAYLTPIHAVILPWMVFTSPKPRFSVTYFLPTIALAYS